MIAHLAWDISTQLLLLLAVGGAACGFGLTILIALRVTCIHSVERWLLSQTLGFGVLSTIMLGLGAIGLYYTVVGWGTVALGLVLLARFGRRSFPLGQAWRVRPPNPTTIIVVALSGTVLLALSYAFLANALVPPVSYDVVAYHFAIPKLYLAAHRIVYIPYIVYSNWPLGTEMLYTLGLVLGSEFLPQLITWSFALIVLVALLCLARGRMSPLAGLWSAGIFFSVPMVVTIAGTGLVEMPLAGYTFVAFYAFWRWWETRAWNWLVIAALVGGFAATTKLNGAATALIMGSLVLVVELWARRPTRALQAFVVYGLVSFLVVFPWYMKSWIFTGNPLWPFLQPLLGGRNWDAQGTENLLGNLRSPNMAATPINWLLGLWYVTRSNGQFGSFLMGPYLLSLMPLAVLPAILDRRVRPLLVNLALVLVSLYTIWFLLTHQTRFLLPATPFMALLAGSGMAWVGQASFKPVRIGITCTAAVWLLGGAWIFNPVRRAEWQPRWAFLQGTISRTDYLTNAYADYAVFRYANASLSPDSCVLFLPLDVRGYYLDRHYLWGNMVGQRFLRLEQFPDAKALEETLQRLGVTHIWLNSFYTYDRVRYWDYDQHLISALLAANGRLVFEAGPTQLYQLAPASPDQASTGVCGH